ncbi:MAG: sulfite exporter TauE/SafE family protein, partial [Acidimicrobiia bacterium]
MELTYWYLLPIAVVIAAIANGAGIGGATFFSPLFILAIGLEPRVAIGVALITEVFGFASGVTAHARARTIDWKVARMLAVVSIPAAVVGSLLASSISPDVLKIILGLGLAVIAVAFIRHRDHKSDDAAISRGEDVIRPAVERVVITRQGERIEYQLCRRNEGRWFAGLGGL